MGPSSPQPHATLVDGDDPEPYAELGWVGEGPERQERFNEALLGYVPGCIEVVRVAQGEPVDCVLVAFHQAREGLRISPQTGSDEFSIFHPSIIVMRGSRER